MSLLPTLRRAQQLRVATARGAVQLRGRLVRGASAAGSSLSSLWHLCWALTCNFSHSWRVLCGRSTFADHFQGFSHSLSHFHCPPLLPRHPPLFGSHFVLDLLALAHAASKFQTLQPLLVATRVAPLQAHLLLRFVTVAQPLPTRHPALLNPQPSETSLLTTPASHFYAFPLAQPHLLLFFPRNKLIPHLRSLLSSLPLPPLLPLSSSGLPPCQTFLPPFWPVLSLSSPPPFFRLLLPSSSSLFLSSYLPPNDIPDVHSRQSSRAKRKVSRGALLAECPVLLRLLSRSSFLEPSVPRIASRAGGPDDYFLY